VELKNENSAPFEELLQQMGISTGELVDPGTRSGKYVLQSSTPRKVTETWNTTRLTSLLRVDPREHHQKLSHG